MTIPRFGLASAVIALLVAGPALAQQDTGSTDNAATPAEQTPAPAPAVETCKAISALEKGLPKVQKVTTLLEQGLAEHSNLISAYHDLRDQVEDSFDERDYQPDCLTQTLTAVIETATPDIDRILPTIVSDGVVDVWSNTCERMTTPDQISACLTDFTTARANGLLTKGQTISMANSLPLEEVSFDDAQMTAFLELVKAQVEAGTLSESQQSSMVDDLLN